MGGGRMVLVIAVASAQPPPPPEPPRLEAWEVAQYQHNVASGRESFHAGMMTAAAGAAFAVGSVVGGGGYELATQQCGLTGNCTHWTLAGVGVILGLATIEVGAGLSLAGTWREHRFRLALGERLVHGRAAASTGWGLWAGQIAFFPVLPAFLPISLGLANLQHQQNLIVAPGVGARVEF